jgi:uncharacterized protein HemX
MALSKPTRLIIAAAVVVVAFLSVRSCSLDKKYRDMKQAYDILRKSTEADHQSNSVIIDTANKDISLRDKKIAALEKEIGGYHDAVAVGSDALAKLQKAEKSIKGKDELVSNLHQQISELTKNFDISQNTVKIKDKIIVEWVGKFNDEVKIARAWEIDYDKEHILRLAAEGLVKKLESTIVRPSWTKTAKNLAMGAVAGIVISKLIK